jgi:ADP-ribose pyrophosphatase YjhB (NUDIX family)
VSSVNLRHSVRAVILDERDRILLCRFTIPEPLGTVVWAAPGGGVAPGETPLDALRRQLRQEIGLTVGAELPHVWQQRVVAPGLAAGYDGVINDHFFVRTSAFRPRGTMSGEELARANLDSFRWWPLVDIADYRGSDLFSPRDLAKLLAILISGGVPARPLSLGL